MNAVTLIKTDHDRVNKLYQQYQNMEAQHDDRCAVVEQICRELEVHAATEEEIFYPALQAKAGHNGADLVKEAVTEHQAMKEMITKLRFGNLEKTDHDRTVHLMMQAVQHHVREEEGEMLPLAEQQLGSDLERLGTQMQHRKEALQRAMPAMGQMAQESLAARKTVSDKDTGSSSNIEASIDVHVPVRVAYNQWTQFEEFPQFMEGIEQVVQRDDTHLHWKATIAGKTKEWDAVITEQIPDQRVAWTNTSGTRNAGVVTFHHLADQHTRVMLQLDYEPEGLVENVGDMLGIVSSRVRADLERFKEFIEARGTETGSWRGTVEQSQK